MNEMDFETRIQSVAKQMDYPRTPDIAKRVMIHIQPVKKPRLARPVAWSLTTILVLLFSLFLIPPARAAIIEIIQIGIVRIFPPSVKPTLQAPITATPASSAPSLMTPTYSALISILDQIAGEVSLAEAQKLVDYPILLPSYPPEMGEPDRVYIQDADGAMTILVWFDPQQQDRIMMSLHFIPTGSWAISKGYPQNILETSINGEPAVWGEGPYPLRLYNGNIEFMRLIEGHVLIWAEGAVTYRLETDLPFLEAVKVAESLKPVP